MSERPDIAPPGLGTRLVWALAGLCAVLVVAQLAFGGEGAGLDARLGLPALAGLLGAAAVILVALGLGRLLRRPEDYYDG